MADDNSGWWAKRLRWPIKNHPRGEEFMRQAFRALGAILIVCVGCAGASAQSWPEKPVRMIVPFPPGGGTDYMGRLVAQFLSKSLGQQVFVENKGGAGGSAGLLALKQAAPDGYTLATTSEGP